MPKSLVRFAKEGNDGDANDQTAYLKPELVAMATELEVSGSESASEGNTNRYFCSTAMQPLYSLSCLMLALVHVSVYE